MQYIFLSFSKISLLIPTFWDYLPLLFVERWLKPCLTSWQKYWNFCTRLSRGGSIRGGHPFILANVIELFDLTWNETKYQSTPSFLVSRLHGFWWKMWPLFFFIAENTRWPYCYVAQSTELIDKNLKFWFDFIVGDILRLLEDLSTRKLKKIYP